MQCRVTPSLPIQPIDSWCSIRVLYDQDIKTTDQVVTKCIIKWTVCSTPGKYDRRPGEGGQDEFFSYDLVSGVIWRLATCDRVRSGVRSLVRIGLVVVWRID